jgi:hypothetical protein
VNLPHALAWKPPHAGKAWGWQYVFPARNLTVDPRSGITHRHQVDPGVVNKATQVAVQRAGLTKHSSAHTFRHSSSHYSSCVDGADLVLAPSLLRTTGRDGPMGTAPDLRESRRQAP